MIKEIKYNGYSAVPSDYESADGDLAAAFGVIPENGALQPALSPSLKFQLGVGETVKFIHKTSSFTHSHYIVYSPSSLNVYYINDISGSRNPIGTLPSPVSRFDAIGNTLLAFTEGGVYYFLWKDNAYVALGNHIPDVQLSFGLVGHPRLFSLSDESKAKFHISFDRIEADKIYSEFSEDNKTKITSQVMAKVNKFIAQETVNKGRFCFPFFVRYALRLYDGSLVCHSAPILMNPSTKAAPIVLWDRATGKGEYTDAECDIMLVAASLDYRLIKNEDTAKLKEWSDIIKSIDVFISKPIYTYDQSGKISSFDDTDNFNTKFIGRLYADNHGQGDFEDFICLVPTEDRILGWYSDIEKPFLDYYCEWDYARIYSMYYNRERKYPGSTLHLPEFSDGKATESLQNTSLFYKLCSIELIEAKNNCESRKNIVVEDDYLQSLVAREVMSDDYLTHDWLRADYSFAYNNRLNLAGLSRKPFNGFYAQSMLAFCNARYNWELGNYVSPDDGRYLKISVVPQSYNYTIGVYIKENGETHVVYSGTEEFMINSFMSGELTVTDSNGNSTTQTSKHSWGCYFFYPNINAYKIVIYNWLGPEKKCYTIDLKPHEFLNGAYAVLDYELVREKDASVTVGISPKSTFPIVIANKIYTSEVNNPFYFPLLGINSVGTGEIKGICAAAKALSQGQFGQFPLYAFTSEGVWALEVSQSGTYSAVQPITRDVVINPDSITQIDSAVLFATERGIMLISGSTVQCISEAIDNDTPFSISQLPNGAALIDIFNKFSADNLLSLDDIALVPFKEFIQNCSMVYDYKHRHIILFNEARKYAYVYSLKSQSWGMMRSEIAAAVNSYPDALAMDSDYRLVDFSNPIEMPATALIITRPFKIDGANTFKTINTLIQRGMFRSAHLRQVLYGSNDLIHWHTVWSSVDKLMHGFRGSPFKAFRLAIICNFDKGESIYGCSISYEPRLGNRLR